MQFKKYIFEVKTKVGISNIFSLFDEYLKQYKW